MNRDLTRCWQCWLIRHTAIHGFGEAKSNKQSARVRLRLGRAVDLLVQLPLPIAVSDLEGAGLAAARRRPGTEAWQATRGTLRPVCAACASAVGPRARPTGVTGADRPTAEPSMAGRRSGPTGIPDRPVPRQAVAQEPFGHAFQETPPLCLLSPLPAEVS